MHITGKKVERKKDRSEIFIELTRSICPVCHQVIDAEILVKENKVFMHKFCPKHGWFDSLIFSNQEMYRSWLSFNKPGTMPLSFASEVKDGCPLDCGLCPDHKQHTCLGVIEITSACNLHCPTCFADSGRRSFLTMHQVEKMLELLITCEGKVDVVQISGGEPTIHPQIIEILTLAKDTGVKIVQLNTNGVRIAEDNVFLEKLSRIKPSIYLQFDGFTSSVYQLLRGQDLLKIKLKAIQKLTERGFNIVLAATIAEGINEEQVGQIACFAIQNKHIRGVLFQPIAYTGRHSNPDPLLRTTLPDVIVHLEKQTGGLLTRQDFFPLPCPFPTCFAVTYVHSRGDQVTTLPRLINVEDYLDYFKNQIITDFSPLTKKALEGLWSACATPGSDEVTNNFASCCGLTLENLQELEEEITMIGVHAFMDPYTFDLKRARKCCIHQILPNGKMIPFCVYNNLMRSYNHG